MNEIPAAKRGVDFKTLLMRMWSNRLRILGVSLAAGLVTLAITFVLPKWYKAEAVILPPEESDLLANMSFAQRALTKFPTFGLLGEYYTPADVFKAVLLSRTAMDEIIDRFDLMTVYKHKKRWKMRKQMKENYTVRLAPDGTISVTVIDRDPERAAQMSMAFLEFLDTYNIETRNTRARRTRRFLERRVFETDSLLRASEELLQLYQEDHSAIVPTGVSSGDVKAATDLMARKISLEVRLGVLRSYLREDHDEVVQTRTELETLKGRIQTLPGMQSELARMIRDAKVYEQLMLLLTAQLEQSRIQETMDTPTVEVLDEALPPERHHSPRKGIMAVIATLITFIGCMGFLMVKPELPIPGRPSA